MSYRVQRPQPSPPPVAGPWTDQAVAAMQAQPEYFVWWYTVKSVGLAVALAALTYHLGKNAGRKER